MNQAWPGGPTWAEIAALHQRQREAEDASRTAVEDEDRLLLLLRATSPPVRDLKIRSLKIGVTKLMEYATLVFKSKTIYEYEMEHDGRAVFTTNEDEAE